MKTSVLGALVCASFVYGMCSANALGEQTKTPPSFQAVTLVVTRQFSSKDFQPQDLITRSQVQAALDRLDKLGWKPSDRQSLLQAVPDDDNDVVTQLRTPKGKLVMRKISKMPLGYDRLFHIRTLDNGKRLVYDVCQGAGGYKLIEYLTEAPGGKTMGRMVERMPHGADFNGPTGQIYTLPSLLARLKKSYQHDFPAKPKQP